jgi:Flp pilus assembly protein protease CpaA
MRESIYSKDHKSPETVNWNALQTEFSPTNSGNLGWMLIQLSAVVFCALGLYLFAGLGAGLAGLVTAWFVLYRD